MIDYKTNTIKLYEEPNCGDRFPLIQIIGSGLYIVNFSSLHSYTFDNGQVLEGCTKEIAYKYKLESHITKAPRWMGVDKDEAPDWYDIDLTYTIPDHMLGALTEIALYSPIDIVLVPYPVMQCFKDERQFISDEKRYWTGKEMIILDKIRVCKKVDSRDISQGILSYEFCR